MNFHDAKLRTFNSKSVTQFQFNVTSFTLEYGEYLYLEFAYKLSYRRITKFSALNYKIKSDFNLIKI